MLEESGFIDIQIGPPVDTFGEAVQVIRHDGGVRHHRSLS